MKTAFLFTILFSATLIHAAPLDEEKIVGGSEVQGNDFPWEVSLGDFEGVPSTPEERKKIPVANKLERHFCGGLLIHKDWVLTAAHCVVDYNTMDTPLDAKSIGAGIGGKDLVNIYDTGRIPASQVIIKKGYRSSSPSSKEDIALVKLSKSATGELACLAKKDPTTPYPSPLTAIGWGNTQPMVIDLPTNEWSEISPPRKLKQAKMDDVSAKSSICKGRPDLLCIQGISAGDGSCKGDSGGSLVSSDNRVVAITSFGGSKPVPRAYQKYQTCNGDAAYTRVAANIKWIEDNIKAKVCAK
ncbi:trypsin-like cysteine/serine peptidase domain-containing protein [Chlamydoabsidia padenii]|nr:trypsin-like cysteine/serine peptidase domain-containing protein [Chlamydoabsidia padenii]